VNGCAFCVTLRERAALALTDAVTKLGEHGVPDDVWNQARVSWSEEEVANVGPAHPAPVCRHSPFLPLHGGAGGRSARRSAEGCAANDGPRGGSRSARGGARAGERE